jgi:hypothetical protein
MMLFKLKLNYNNIGKLDRLLSNRHYLLFHLGLGRTIKLGNLRPYTPIDTPIFHVRVSTSLGGSKTVSSRSNCHSPPT